MALRQPKDAAAKERIYVYGDSGAGKSHAWLSIAALADKTGADTQFFVVDTDMATETVLDPGGPFDHLSDRIHIWNVYEWEEYREAGKAVRKEAGPEDWIVVDMLSNAWEILPSWWIANVFQEDTTDYWSTMRRVALGNEEGDKGFGGMKGGVDWQFITKVYLDFEKPISMGARSHVFATAAESQVSELWDKSGEERATFGQVGGYKPAGQKRTRHRFHSTMRLKRIQGESEALLVRDRGKEHIWAEKAGRGVALPIKEGDTGFAMSYLKGIRGWKL